MSTSGSRVLLAVVLLLGAPNVAALEFDTFSVAFTGCAGLDGGDLVLSTCYEAGTSCSDSTATLVATVPGTFTFDVLYDQTGYKDYTRLEVWTDGGQAFSYAGLPFQDWWCTPQPCNGVLSSVSIIVQPGDTIQFWLTNSGEPCDASIDDGTRTILTNLAFLPEVGIHDLGYALDATPLLWVPAEDLGGANGLSDLATVGDLDGDGAPDLLAGTALVVDDGVRGEVRAFSGQDGALLWAFPGTVDGGLGRSVAGLGDVDGDGVPDVAAGESDFGANERGRVRVLSGLDGAVVATLPGEAANDNFGEAIAGPGDVDGDGRQDVVVGVPGDDSAGVGAGRVQVWSADGTTLVHDHPGDVAFDYLGSTVAAVGDVDADGFPDYAGTALFSDLGASSGGLVRVWSGDDGAVLYEFTGDAGDQLGRAVDGAGDVNADGFADMLIGASSAAGLNGVSSAGYAEVRSGADGSLLFVRSGRLAGQRLGSDLAGVGDLDGDGFDDIALSDHTWQDRGRVRVFAGPLGAPLVDVASSGHDFFGWRLAGGVDIDADGTGDLIAVGRTPLIQWELRGVSGDAAAAMAPALTAAGDLLAGTPLDLSITGGPQGPPTVLVLGLATLDAPYFGGMLVPSLDAVLVAPPVDAAGELRLPTTWPANVVAPSSIVAQAWWPVPGVGSGALATNALALSPP